VDFSIAELNWYWFKGNAVTARLLQDTCLFRSHVLFDSGTRKDFGKYGKRFGDVQYADFESYHIVACRQSEILGTIRVTPPLVETVGASVLGPEDYAKLLDHVGARAEQVIEINRLMIDRRIRKSELGRTLMYAAVALIENLWDRQKMVILGSAGNNTKQTQFFVNYTDYELIPGVANKFADTFNDQITFIKYKNPPYVKGADWIEVFKREFRLIGTPPFVRFDLGYTPNETDSHITAEI
jgi:predicted GNAT family N-acyltransferase